MEKDIHGISRKTTYLLPVCLLVIDYVMVTLGIFSAFHARRIWMYPEVAANFHIKKIYIFFIAPALFLFMMFLTNCYQIAIPYWDRVRNLFKGVTYSIILTVFLMYAANVAGDVSRLFILFSWIITFGTVLIGTINNGLSILNIVSYYQQLLLGVVIILAVLLEQFKKK